MNKENEKYENANEDRENYYVDVERMLDDGLSGGKVSMSSGKIEEARDFDKETPPHEVEES